MKNVGAIVVAVTVAAIIGCQDGSITTPETSVPEPQGLTVSSPTLSALSTGGTGGGVGRESLAFVSLVPGSAPEGLRASIRNRANGVAQTVAVIDGGFDPVGIAAHVSDSIEIAVTNIGGVVVLQAVVAVKAPRKPIVVRTNPPGKKTDVPLNMVIEVVFSAPIDSATLTPSSILLLRGTASVPGTLQFGDSTRTIVEFRPDNLLAGATSYRLVVSQAIQDVNHLVLQSPVDIEFTTEINPLANAKLVFLVQPSGTTAGVAISPPLVVAVQDASGNIIADVQGPVTIGWAIGATGTLSGATTVNMVNGLAAFADLSIAEASSAYRFVAYKVIASPNLTSAPSTLFSVAPAAASKIVLAGPSAVDATRQFAVGVRVTDAFGNGVTATATNSVSLTFGSNPSGATLAGTLTVPLLGGAATFANLAIDRPGTYVLQATSGSTGGSIKLDVWNRDAFTQVSAGGAHTCAVTRDGLVYCWGANANGQVGVGTTIDYAGPVIVASGMLSVSAGGSHTCATSDRLFCWGLNNDGQLGDGTITPRLVPTPTREPFGYINLLLTGGAHTCVIFDFGPWDYGEAFKCWGNNVQNQLGTLSTYPTVFPLTAGGSHTCGTDYAGLLYCWGANKNGQLGGGTLSPSSVSPLSVATYEYGAAMSAGRSHTCANTSVGSAKGLFCWGLNDDGQLGDGTTIQRTRPVLVSGGPFSSVAAGGAHSCALTAVGEAYCWGANDHGQVGDGTTTNRSTPVLVAGGLTFVSLSAGGSHTCGVTATGTYCWGANGNGQLGNDTTVDSAVPVKVAGQ